MPKQTSETEPLLLDTHAWIWLIEGNTKRVAPAARRKMIAASEDGRLLVSAISVWEIGMLVAKNRLAFQQAVHEWIAEALTLPGLRLVELMPEIALDSSNLPGSPGVDPADRILIATARRMDATLATADRNILKYARRADHLRALNIAG